MIVLADERCRRKRVARRAARGCAAGERHGTCSKREGEFGLGDSAHGRSSWQAIRSARVANARRSKADADLHPLWLQEVNLGLGQAEFRRRPALGPALLQYLSLWVHDHFAGRLLRQEG